MYYSSNAPSTSNEEVSLATIALARYRLSRYLSPTPITEAVYLGKNTFLKLECWNKTRSFKIRGALNVAITLKEELHINEVIAASSGNHAQALALACSMFDIRARIVVPKNTPKRKVDGIERYNAEAIIFGDTYNESEQEARRIEKEEGIFFVSPYNNYHVISGAGTLGLELLDQIPKLERVLVPVSGAGFVCGVAVAVKSVNPFIEVIGVCAESAPSMYNQFYGTDFPQKWDTLADGLTGDIEANSITIDLARKYVDKVVLVTEAQIENAMRCLVFDHGIVVEGAGAVTYAAAMQVVEHTGRPTAVILSGGNVDEETLLRVLNNALAWRKSSVEVL